MNVELIKMDPEAAKQKLAAYRKAIAARKHKTAATLVSREYDAIENAYRVAAQGKPLIELPKAMAVGGWKGNGQPGFAVARADAKRVECHVGHENALCFSTDQRSACWNARGLRVHRFPVASMPPRGERPAWNGRTIQAIVPMVPPDVLPRPDCDLSKRLILWEADWQTAPVDPLLLLPIGGDLYAVEAAWDLSPLERAVIAGTRAE